MSRSHLEAGVSGHVSSEGLLPQSILGAPTGERDELTEEPQRTMRRKEEEEEVE